MALARRHVAALTGLLQCVLSGCSNPLPSRQRDGSSPEVVPSGQRDGGSTEVVPSGQRDDSSTEVVPSGQRDGSPPEVLGGQGDVGTPLGSSNSPGCNGLRIAPQTSIGVHLPVPPSGLLGASATVCQNATCTTGTYEPPKAGMIWGGFSLLGLGGMVEDELDGFCEAQFSYALTEGAYADGDVYSVRIVDAGGQTLIDVSRPVQYGLENVDLRCGKLGNRYANLELYPSSASGILCGNNYCVYPGARLNGSVATATPFVPTTITLCRNGTYYSGTETLQPCPADASCVYSGSLMDYYLGNFEIQAKGDGIAFGINSNDDSAALADGDVYQVVVTQGSDTLLSKSVTVTYLAEYLNGPQCDPIPCRHATVDLGSFQ